MKSASKLNCCRGILQRVELDREALKVLCRAQQLNEESKRIVVFRRDSDQSEVDCHCLRREELFG